MRQCRESDSNYAGTSILGRLALGFAIGVASALSFSRSLLGEEGEAGPRLEETDGRRCVFKAGAADGGRETLPDRRDAAVADEGGDSEERGLTLTAVDGGSTRRAVETADPEAEGRTVRDTVTDVRAAEAGSLFLRCLAVATVLLTSERTEEGREIAGVPKMEDSRRPAGLAAVFGSATP